MGLHLPRFLATAAICASLSAAVLTGTANGAARGVTVDPAAAAKACAAQPGATQPINTATPGYLAGLASCLLRNERGQLGVRYARDRGISQMIAAALRRFVALPYAHDQQAARQAEDLASSNIGRAVCASKRPGLAQDEWAFADIKPPANATPLQVAKLLAGDFEATGAVGRAAGAEFGIAARPGLLFEPNHPMGTSFGVVAIVCS